MSASSRELASRMEQIMRADLRFFERFPARRHRIRLTSQAEKELHRLGKSPPTRQWYTVVKCLSASTLRCIEAEYDAGLSTDVSERTAAAIFDLSCGTKFR